MGGRRIGKVLCIAHRGASAYEPENTLRSVNAAISLGADMVEVDVRLSRDEHVVVFHDETVERTSNGSGYVKKMTLKEIKQLDVGKGERVPTLEEVISAVKGKLKLVVELKEPAVVEGAVQLVERLGVGREVLLTSFHHPAVRRVKMLAPPGQDRGHLHI